MFAKSSWRRRIERVAEMSRDEIRVRTTQEISKRWDLASSKLRILAVSNGRTVPFGGRGRFFFQRDEVPGIVGWLRGNLPEVPNQIIEAADRILKHRFDLLGYESLDYGPNIDWHFDAVHRKASPRIPWFRVRYLDFDRVGDHKVIWELNRHQHLVTLAKAYRLTGNGGYADELFRQWYDWQQQNPYPIGINWASSLEIAFRSLSWLWVWHLLEGCSVVPSQFASDLARALMQNGRHIERYLSTYFAPNTHLLGEAVALFFIGTLAPPSHATLRWQQLGWRLILQEAQRQVQLDGMHFEQSLYYHVYALDFFLHSRILADANGIAIPLSLDETMEKMLEVLCTLSATGPLPQFGDDDGGRVFDSRRNHRGHMLDPLAVGTVLFRRADFKKAACGAHEEMVWLFGKNGAEHFKSLASSQRPAASFALHASGIFVMSGADPQLQQLVIDAGRQGFGLAGHGHADALSVQLAAGGKPILTDPGTFTYVTASSERGRFRETACHNTVQVDGVSQSEPAGPFKWHGLAHGKADRWITGESFDLFVGSHEGYKRLASPVLHQRHVFYLKPHFWLVRDVLTGVSAHQIDICWNFAPGDLFRLPGGVQFVGVNGGTLTALVAADGDFHHELSQGWYSPRYGHKEPSPQFCVRAKTELPAECATLLIPTHEKKGHFELIPAETEAQAGVPVHGYQLSINGMTYQTFFSDAPGAWSSGRFRSDARFVYFAVRATGILEQYILCDGTYLEVDGNRVFASIDAPVTKAEWSMHNEYPILFHNEAQPIDPRIVVEALKPV
jgi:hypothetical protein